MTGTQPLTTALRRLALRSSSAFYAALASWQENKRGTIDPQIGIESAVRYSELTDKTNRSRELSNEFRRLAEGIR